MKNQSVINIALIFTFLLSGIISFDTANADHPRGGLDNGDVAPDFSLPDADNRMVKLSGHEGNENVVLVFYRGQW